MHNRQNKPATNHIFNIDKLKKIVSIALVLISAVFFFSILRYSYSYTVKNVDLNEIPLIKKSECATAMSPNDPGGLALSNQDKTLYDNFKQQALPKVAEKESKAIIDDSQQKIEGILKEVKPAIKEEAIQEENSSNPNIAPPTEAKPIKGANPSAAPKEAVNKEKINDVFAVLESNNSSISNKKFKIQIGEIFKSKNNALQIVNKMCKITDNQPRCVYEILSIGKDSNNKLGYKLYIKQIDSNNEAQKLCRRAKEQNQKCVILNGLH